MEYYPLMNTQVCRGGDERVQREKAEHRRSYCIILCYIIFYESLSLYIYMYTYIYIYIYIMQ